MLMRALFRVDSGSLIGNGHMIRCLNLARELIRVGIPVTFLTKKHVGNIIDKLDKAIDVVTVQSTLSYKKFIDSDYTTWNDESDEAEFRRVEEIIEENKITHLFTDHYGLSLKFDNLVMGLRKIKYFVIDDIFRKHHCDYLLDQNYGVTEKNYLGSIVDKYFLGPKYALLDKRFNELREKKNKNLTLLVLRFWFFLEALIQQKRRLRFLKRLIKQKLK